ncbi:MAG TPA: transcriptional regulator [Phycisphaerales bacterium]|nr:transcriptional regulator [Phycisphaerales bacterium]
MLPAQPNASLMDGVTCLQALATADAPVGVRELARRLGMETTRVNRLLKTLAHIGMARQTAGRKYVPGPGMHVLSAQSLHASGLIRRALPALEALGPLGCTVALGVLWRDSVCYLYHAIPGMPPEAALGRVGVFPAAQSGIGLALLAAMGDDEVRALYAARPPAGGIESLLEKLAEVRRDGYAFVQTRHRPRTVTLAVGVGDPPYAAVALAGDISARSVPRLAKLLRDAAGKMA